MLWWDAEFPARGWKNVHLQDTSRCSICIEMVWLILLTVLSQIRHKRTRLSFGWRDFLLSFRRVLTLCCPWLTDPVPVFSLPLDVTHVHISTYPDRSFTLRLFELIMTYSDVYRVKHQRSGHIRPMSMVNKASILYMVDGWFLVHDFCTTCLAVF